jgi:hypothetical protein
MLSAIRGSSSKLPDRVMRITPERGGRWAVRTDEEQLSTYPDASAAQRAARVLARDAGCSRVLLQDCYGRTHELPPVVHQ